MGSLAEDLLVLAVMAENAGVQSARRMPYVLRGAELIQLCIDGRITVTDGRIKVVNARETGSPDLDAALASLAQRGQQPSADVWVREARDQMVHGYLRHLQDAGVLRRRRLSLPASVGMSPRYRAADPARAGQIRDRIDAAVRDPNQPRTTRGLSPLSLTPPAWRLTCIRARRIRGSGGASTRSPVIASPRALPLRPLPASGKRCAPR